LGDFDRGSGSVDSFEVLLENGSPQYLRTDRNVKLLDFNRSRSLPD
jgi:hypothetical protein